jgi:hypothetical protein
VKISRLMSPNYCHALFDLFSRALFSTHNSRSAVKGQENTHQQQKREFFEKWNPGWLHATPSFIFAVFQVKCSALFIQVLMNGRAAEQRPSRKSEAHASSSAEQTPATMARNYAHPWLRLQNGTKSRASGGAPAARSRDTIARIPLDQCIKN